MLEKSIKAFIPGTNSMNTISELISQEELRQATTINLIASENYVSKAVLAATGSVLTNKYAEGYPHKRYYSGCQIIDQVEERARELGKQLFQAEHINVQPHSGSQANFAVYMTILKPGDTVLGMGLGSGGHLTHGHALNFSGKFFNIVPYNVSPQDERLDYNEIELLAQQHKPKLIIAGASAYSQLIDFVQIAKIAQSIGAYFLADIAHVSGLVVAGLHPNPIPVADFVTSTTHKTLRGPRGGLICSKLEHAQKLDRAIIPGAQGGPLMHVIAAKAIAFEEALRPDFIKYQQQVVKNAQALCNTMKELGYHIVSGDTKNHLCLINLKKSKINNGNSKPLTGLEAEKLLESCNITLNRNAVPFDDESPLITSGIRIGTPAITSRGFQEKECREIAHLIDEALRNRDNDFKLKNIKHKVLEFCTQFPIK